MIWSAFILGIMGSIHCLAMCGPLVITLNARRRQSPIDKLFYNMGRISTYGLLGALVGLFGTGIGWAIGQQYLSIVSGVLLLLGLVVAWVSTKRFSILPGAFARVKIKLGKILDIKSGNTFLFGVFNGLLPCGLTYVALAAAVSTGSLLESILYMVLFGVGTSPMMWAIVSGFQHLKPTWISGKRVITTFTWLLAILLIVRGLDLGIPYLSPNFESGHMAPISVCN